MWVDQKKASFNLKKQTFKIHMVRLIVLMSLCVSAPIQAQIASLLMTPEQRQLIDFERQAYLTKPIVKKDDKTPEKIEAPGLVMEGGTLFVSAILQQNGHKRVQINGVIYKAPESKLGVQVHRIDDQSVTLTTNGKWGRAKIGVLYDLNDWPNPPESKIKTRR
ncbi:MAG: hypothetical protein IBX48_01275 [Thiomicrospira sp.]|uniref:hypothetical protein n=1 Tax=Thiomicrospira sp. TaxID=935 RepID=UPI0019E5DE27|nr:hypothetical protein [Thiomicrospira sp.]MBE0492951.1 hypothetical protein [Thiomicrospira sp.]